MWNRWTSSTTLAALCGACALAAPPAVDYVDYAWLTVRDGTQSLSESLPAGTHWDAAVVVAPVAPFAEPATALLTLVTGDIIPGDFVEAVETPQGLTIVWESGRLGEYRVPLRDIARITLDTARTETASVVLRNGDTLDLQPALTPQGLRADTPLGDTLVPWARLASLRLRTANDPSGTTRVWLRNGGAITIDRIDERTGGFFLRTPEGRGAMYHAGEIIAITRGHYRVRPIGPPATDDDDAIDHTLRNTTARGHTVMRWERTGREIALLGAVQAPEDSVQWADALVSVWDDSDLVFSSRTRRERPAIAIGTTLTPAAHTLTLSVQPGAAGSANAVVQIALAVIERAEPRDEKP